MTIDGGRPRQISELQSDAAGVVAAALNRAIWALDLARAMGDVKEGNFERCPAYRRVSLHAKPR